MHGQYHLRSHNLESVSWLALELLIYFFRNYLGKALAIAQLRSPSRDDGTTARILWKISLVLESDIFGTFHKEADDMRIRAEMARRAIVSDGQGYVAVSINEECNADAAEEEDYYDALVPYVFRMKSC